jgi:hypothetical protein
MERRLPFDGERFSKAAPVALVAIGIVMGTWGLYSGMHGAHLLLEGETSRGVVAAVERVRARSSRAGRSRSRHEDWTVIHAGGGTCRLRGNFGPVGRTVTVHHAHGNPADCVLDRGQAMRDPFLRTAIGVAALAVAYALYQRARRRESVLG